jgi:hypothetical protein
VIVYDDIEQGSGAWYLARAGIPTSSEFAKIMAKPGPRGGTSSREQIGRKKLLWRLAGEIITGEPEATYSNFDMERGKENEAEARDLYAFLREAEPVQVGFIKNGNCGASPDALIGDDGLLEIKDAKGSVQVERLIDGTLPSEYRAQVQGQLMVSERSWVDFMSHSRGLPPLIVRVERDEAYIAELREAVDRFVAELEQLVTWLRAM